MAMLRRRVHALSRDDEVWRSFDNGHSLRFRMKGAEGAVVCVVSRKALLALPGVADDADDETLLHAFEAHVGRFEEIAEAKYAEGGLVNGEIRIHAWDILNIPTV